MIKVGMSPCTQCGSLATHYESGGVVTAICEPTCPTCEGACGHRQVIRAFTPTPSEKVLDEAELCEVS